MKLKEYVDDFFAQGKFGDSEPTIRETYEELTEGKTMDIEKARKLLKMAKEHILPTTVKGDG